MPNSAPSTKSTITLKALCTEMKIDPRIARIKLRKAVQTPGKFPELAKAHKAREPWEWVDGSPALKEARQSLAEE